MTYNKNMYYENVINFSKKAILPLNVTKLVKTRVVSIYIMLVKHIILTANIIMFWKKTCLLLLKCTKFSKNNLTNAMKKFSKLFMHYMLKVFEVKRILVANGEKLKKNLVKYS